MLWYVLQSHCIDPSPMQSPSRSIPSKPLETKKFRRVRAGKGHRPDPALGILALLLASKALGQNFNLTPLACGRCS